MEDASEKPEFIDARLVVVGEGFATVEAGAVMPEGISSPAPCLTFRMEGGPTVIVVLINTQAIRDVGNAFAMLVGRVLADNPELLAQLKPGATH